MAAKKHEIDMARPGKIEEWATEYGLLQLTGWARDGFTNKQIAEECIGISYRTLYKWFDKGQLGQAIKKAIEEGRAPVGVKVEDAFYSRCDWKEIVEKKEEIWKDAEGKEHKKLTRFTRIIPPDSTCLIFALKNLMPERWRDRQKELVVTTKHEIDPLSAAFNALEEASKEKKA